MLAEISKDVLHFAELTPVFDEWPECRQSLLEFLSEDNLWVHALPVLSCLSVGGKQQEAIPVAVAWLTLMHAADLIDYTQDGDFILAKKYACPENAITLAIAWIFAAFHLLGDPSINGAARNRVTAIFSQAGFESALGQYQGHAQKNVTQTSRKGLETYWQATILKSGSIGMAGAACGAAIGTTSQALIEALGDYGLALGVIKQVIDDCRDSFEDTNGPASKHRLPALLHSMVSAQSSKNAIKRGNFVEAGIPEIITDILLEWKQRGKKNLSILEPSEARDALEHILELALNPTLSTS